MRFKKVFLLTMLLCTPQGWLWNYFHMTHGAVPAWIFPNNSWSGLSFLGMTAEDWSFFPLTGAAFTLCVFVDPILLLWNKLFPLVKLSDRLNERCKWFFFWMLTTLTTLFCLCLGKSGMVTALMYGVPSIAMYIYIWKEWNAFHFIRTGLIVVIIEFGWDHLAAGKYAILEKQWVYMEECGLFGKLWLWEIPIDMTPGLGFFAWYYIFGVVMTLVKIFKRKEVIC